MATPPSRVPDLPADLIEGVGGPLHDVEGVHAANRLRAAQCDHVGDPVPGIGGVVGDQLGAVLAEFHEEAVKGLLIAAFGHPDQPPAVMVNDHDQVLLPAPERHLVDPDPAQALELVLAGPQAPADPGTIQPTVRQETRISSETALWLHCTASQATCSSKLRVKRASWSAQGTTATATPCTGQLTRGASASMKVRVLPRSRARQRRRPSPAS